MQRIDELVCEINKKILDIDGTSMLHGVSRRTLRDKDNVIYDENQNQVILTDNYNHFGYHLFQTESYEPLKAAGKAKKSKAVSTIELVCYSESRNYDDHVKECLSAFPDVVIVSFNPNGLTLFQRDVGNPKDMNFNIGKYLFSITYRINHIVNFCTDCGN